MTMRRSEGGAFDSIYVALVLYREGKVARYEFFEPGDLDKALARFEVLLAEIAADRADA